MSIENIKRDLQRRLLSVLEQWEQQGIIKNFENDKIAYYDYSDSETSEYEGSWLVTANLELDRNAFDKKIAIRRAVLNFGEEISKSNDCELRGAEVGKNDTKDGMSILISKRRC